MLPLKDATAAKHKIAERMPFNIRMFSGRLDKNNYLLYLVQQLEIFSSIEKNELPHPSLNRVEAIRADIAELEAQGCKTTAVLDATTAYSGYLRNLSPDELLPHIYLNYLAIMFGGQMMKTKVPSSGRFYDFEDMPAALAAVRAVQKDEWAGEVNKGFDFTIGIFADLENTIINHEKAMA
ncbi:MAG: biliverdin-producing heme oxygenase [Ferruginibacter sp.]